MADNKISLSIKRACVLLPDYSTTGVDYQHYDPPRNLSPLLPDATVDHVFLNKLTVYKQLKALKKNNYDIFINLCEGYLDWEVPSIDVIYFLELLGLPYTGPNTLLYDPDKEQMKYVAYTVGVTTPKHMLIRDLSKCESLDIGLAFPLFVKPAKAGDSLGIDDRSLVKNKEALTEKVAEIIHEYDEALVEEYIYGREFTVLVVRDKKADGGVHAYRPIEYVFDERASFKTYSLKTSSLHPTANVSVLDPVLEDRIKRAAVSIFRGFGGVGYARLDFRMDASGVLFFLEINFTCSVFYTDGYEGPADHILRLDGLGPVDFLHRIIRDGLDRFANKIAVYEMRGNAICGYGIYAKKDLGAGTVIFRGEERSQRIATKRHIESTWGEAEMDQFRKYAYPVSDAVFLLWDESPLQWAPQNHSCNANTAYVGLNVVAKRLINAGEELTLDYADFLDEHAEPFACQCGSTNCRKQIQGSPHNTIDSREKNR
ncbi:MAG: SET domain-containing protein-lysine N-methyltransferase [Ferruginibacter sp.]